MSSSATLRRGVLMKTLYMKLKIDNFDQGTFPNDRKLPTTNNIRRKKEKKKKKKG
jgi:hypothetical protein